MNKFITRKRLLLIGLLVSASCSASADVIDQKLNEYRTLGAETFSAAAGLSLWQSDNNGRSCTQCHGQQPVDVGKHNRTGKRIEPMALSVNPDRFNDSGKIDKWFLRNCKWTFKRTCTAQEKGDFLIWIREQ